MENKDPRFDYWEDKTTWKFIEYRNSKGSIVKVKHKETGAQKYVLTDVDFGYIKDIPLPFKISDYL